MSRYGVVLEIHAVLLYAFLATAFHAFGQFRSFPHDLLDEPTGLGRVGRISGRAGEMFKGPGRGEYGSGKAQVGECVDSL